MPWSDIKVSVIKIIRDFSNDCLKDKFQHFFIISALEEKFKFIGVFSSRH